MSHDWKVSQNGMAFLKDVMNGQPNQQQQHNSQDDPNHFLLRQIFNNVIVGGLTISIQRKFR
jgi:hypothetical protein